MGDQTQGWCHYTALGRNKTATQADIKKAYTKLVLVHHPDKGGEQDVFVKIQEAYETLKDPILRQAYDKNQQDAEPRKAKKREVKPKPKARAGPSERAGQPMKESRAQPQHRKHGDVAETRRQGEPFFKERRPNPASTADHEENFKERRPRHCSASSEQRGRADSSSGEDSFLGNDSFFDDDDFMGDVFEVVNEHTANCHRPADKNRKEPQARERRQDGQAREKVSPKHPEGEASEARGRILGDADFDVLTFDSLLLRAENRRKHFSNTVSKLDATTGPHFPYSNYSDVWCHLQYIKDLLEKRILAVELAQ